MAAPVRIQHEDFDLSTETKQLCGTSSHIGGIVSFAGTVRDTSTAGPVAAVDCVQYEGMALAELEALRREALQQFDIIEARLVHRVGRLAAGEQIVCIVVGAEHRAAAFDACRWLIDAMKQRLPIWKKELGPQGGTWLGGAT